MKSEDFENHCLLDVRSPFSIRCCKLSHGLCGRMGHGVILKKPPCPGIRTTSTQFRNKIRIGFTPTWIHEIFSWGHTWNVIFLEPVLLTSTRWTKPSGTQQLRPWTYLKLLCIRNVTTRLMFDSYINNNYICRVFLSIFVE